MLCFFLALTSCYYYHVNADYSFHNKLDEDVELYLYVSHTNYKSKIPAYSMIPKRDSVQLISLEWKSRERGGFGENYFHLLVDSAKVKLYGEDHYIAVWRQNGEHEIADGYEGLRDFYTYWSKIHQHGGSHAEYAYILELRDK